MRDTGWFKTRRSGSGNDACVEVRIADVVGVRDSKNASGVACVFSAGEWRAFVDAAKTGDFDLRS